MRSSSSHTIEEQVQLQNGRRSRAVLVLVLVWVLVLAFVVRSYACACVRAHACVFLCALKRDYLPRLMDDIQNDARHGVC